PHPPPTLFPYTTLFRSRPVLYVGGGVLSARATAELEALAEALEVPVAHTLMGKGCLSASHPLLLGQSGFWGTPISNDKCRTADRSEEHTSELQSLAYLV